MPGWDDHTYGYHSDDGKLYGMNKTGNWETYGSGSVIGCGYNCSTKSIFYTLNGVLLGTAFTEVRETELYPVLSMKGDRVVASINMGQKPFRCPINRCTRLFYL